MSDLQQPMYGGVRMNAASSTPAPVQTADVSTKPAQRALQNAQEFVSDVAHQYQRMKDFGEQTRLEGQMDTLATEFEQEMTKRLGFARGHELSFYNGDGTLKESSLNTFVRNYEGKLRGLKGTFVAQEEAARFGARQQDVMRRLQGRATELLLKGQIQESRQALDAKLKLAEERKDWGSYEDAVMGGLNAGLLAPDQAELMKEKANKINLGQQFDNLSATNPDLAAEKINRGELDGYFSAAEQEQMMRSLRSHDDSRLTELIEQIASKPKSQSSKQDVVDVMMSGSMYTDEVGFLDVFSKDGNFEACSPQIDSFIYRVADMVQAGEEGATFASKKEDVIRLCKKYGKSSEFKQDVLNRMDKLAKRKEEYPMLKVSERMKEMEGAPLFRQADYNNAIGTLDAEAKSAYQLYADSAKGADMPKDSEGTWTKKYKNERIENLQKNLAAKTEIAVRERFEAWYEGEKQRNGKEPSNVLQEDQLQLILRDVTGRKDLVVPSRGRLLDKNQQHARKEWVERDEVRFNTGPKTLTDSEKQALQQKEALRKPVTFPATVSVDTVNTEAPAGILLPESMRKRYGDDVSGLAALVPVSSSSRRGKPLPVVGYTKDSSPQLTLAGASKMRITFSSKMDTNVTISPASAEMREFFKREYLQEDDVPPQDYGLVPDNGVESAEPVSAAFPNGDLTMLPPL